jgi:CheY-like chemotaxis protein
VEKAILFIDDEFAPDTDTHFGSYMSYYEVALKEAGFKVQRANGCDEALKIARRQRFDLAILDVLMPPGVSFQDADTKKGLTTGLFLARRLHDGDPSLPIIFLSNAGGNKSLFEQVLEERVVEQVLFKLDTTPSELVSYAMQKLFS